MPCQILVSDAGELELDHGPLHTSELLDTLETLVSHTGSNSRIRRRWRDRADIGDL
jgi:hypothetical protein